MTAPEHALLTVRELRVRLGAEAEAPQAVRGLSFTLARGETLGLVGESGCGKSLTALALMGLLPEGAQASGQAVFDGMDLLSLPERERCTLRGRRLAMIFQEPMTALNPLHRVGDQVAEPLRLHLGLDRAAAQAESWRLLDRVGLPEVRRCARAYPHELSGGQRQRVMIAMALACGPELLIADEPTTALDVSVQGQILDLLADLVAERGMGLILISHDLGVIAENVQRLLVMYAGTAVESGPTAAVFARMAHPYTQGLMAARPRLGGPRRHLATIPGSVPPLGALPPGCPFAPRCALATLGCSLALPPANLLGGGHEARCLHIDQALTRGEAR